MHEDLHKLTCAHKHTFSHYRWSKLVRIDHVLSYIGSANTVVAHQIQPQSVGVFLDRLPSSYFPLQCNPTGAAQRCGGKNVHARWRTEEKHCKTKQTVMQGKGLTMAATRKHINVALGNSSTLPLVRLQIWVPVLWVFFLNHQIVKVAHFCSGICAGRRVRRKRGRKRHAPSIQANPPDISQD